MRRQTCVGGWTRCLADRGQAMARFEDDSTKELRARTTDVFHVLAQLHSEGVVCTATTLCVCVCVCVCVCARARARVCVCALW
jgi:hypothetical protein